MAGPAWWKEAVVYQIYPRSFRDSNGDGIGDLRGIIDRVSYLASLGINVVWLSPVYRSPNDDNGYDISDYQAINPEFGTLADWQELFAALHRHGIKLLMDLVVNHTSDEHPWFIASRASAAAENPYREYYFWRPPGPDGREPNNWRSFFGGSAWQLDPATNQYYLHLFSRKQPDLNWDHPRVRADVYAMMHWWLRQGIDGFRMDVVNMLSKVPGLPDALVTTPDRYQFGGRYFIHGPRLLEYLAEMDREVLSHYDIFTVGETPLTTTEHAVDITNEETGHLNMLFQFEHMDIDRDPAGASKWQSRPWHLLDLKQVMTRWQKELEGRGWNSFYLSNHDQPRSVSRFGDDGRYRVASAKLLATFLHLLHGTPYIYQGEEIGMTNVPFESIDDYRDIETLNTYREFVQERGLSPHAALSVIRARSRDNARTPMQWDASPTAGFTTGQPWIAVNSNTVDINVEQAERDPDSILHYYRALIRLRASQPVMVYGRYDLLLDAHEQIYAFTRTLDDQQLLVMLNFSADRPVFALPTYIDARQRSLLIANYPVADAAEDLASLTLRPYEARVYQLRRQP
jgi:oligo-1,6-glucosidase